LPAYFEANSNIFRHRRPKDENDPALFINRDGVRLEREGLSLLVRRIMVKAGVSGKAGPHKLRRTFATSFLRHGGNLEALRRILRHSNIVVTQRYTNLLTEDVMNQHRMASPLDNLDKKRY
jgi:integrase/recombinase XerD